MPCSVPHLQGEIARGAETGNEDLCYSHEAPATDGGRGKNEDGEGSEDSEPLLEPGDCLLITVSTSNIPVPMITATATTSQQLAEKALQSIPAKEKELLPLYLCDFEDVFVKEFFDSLPE